MEKTTMVKISVSFLTVLSLCFTSNFAALSSDNEYSKPIQTSITRPRCWHQGKRLTDLPIPPPGLDSNPDYNTYKRWMWVEIALGWRPVRCKCGIEALVTVDKSGMLVSAKITKSSKDTLMNEEALRAIRSAEFKKFPKSWKDDTRQFRIDFNDLEYYPPEDPYNRHGLY